MLLFYQVALKIVSLVFLGTEQMPPLLRIHSLEARRHRSVKGILKQTNRDDNCTCFMFWETLSLSDKRIFWNR